MATQNNSARAWFLTLTLSVLGAGLSSAADEPVFESELHRFKIATVTRGLEHPWSLAFLPDGAMLVTQRPGRLRLVRDGMLDQAPVSGTPSVAASGQGGLLDVALHPDFANNHWIYLSYAGKGPGGAGTEVARGRLVANRLENLETIFAVTRKSGGGRHFGSRLAFGAYGMLYITAGERGDSDRAQGPLNAAGSVSAPWVRLTLPVPNKGSRHRIRAIRSARCWPAKSGSPTKAARSTNTAQETLSTPARAKWLIGWSWRRYARSFSAMTLMQSNSHAKQ